MSITSFCFTSEIGLELIGLQYRFVRSQHCLCPFSPFQEGRRCSITMSKASSTVGMIGGGLRMSSPW